MEQGNPPPCAGSGAAVTLPVLRREWSSSYSPRSEQRRGRKAIPGSLKNYLKISLFFGVYTVDPARVDTYNAQPRIWAGMTRTA